MGSATSRVFRTGTVPTSARRTVWAVGATGRMARGFDVVGTHSRPFADEDSEALRDMLRHYHALAASNKQWIQVVLERIQRSKRQGAAEGKILDLGIAAEMLLLRDQNETDPIALPFRLRGSWLLGSGHRRRLEIYELLKALYSYRCQIRMADRSRARSMLARPLRRFQSFMLSSRRFSVWQSGQRTQDAVLIGSASSLAPAVRQTRPCRDLRAFES